MFPLGDSTKSEVRAEAARRGLAVADKPDSHDICFIADGDTRGFLQRRLGDGRRRHRRRRDRRRCSAPTRDRSRFTVGQRRGLRLDRPAPDGDPRYVLSIRPKDNTVVVGRGELLDVSEVRADRPVWTGARPADSFECIVQLRAHGMVSAATVTVSDDGVVAQLHSPQRGVAAGQALVLYDGDEVLGSATIARHAQPRARMTRVWAPGAVTGLGSLPGTDPPRQPGSSSANCPTCRTFPSCPTVDAAADLIGRGIAALVDLPAEIVPSGWRLASRPGNDLRRAQRSARLGSGRARGAGRGLRRPAEDPARRAVDARGERRAAQRAPGRQRPRRHARPGRVARPRGCGEQLDDLARRVPGAALVVQLDEPALPSVLRGTVPTPSGYGIVARRRGVRRRNRRLPILLALAPTVASCTAAPPTSRSPCCSAPGPMPSRSTRRCSRRNTTTRSARRSTPGCRCGSASSHRTRRPTSQRRGPRSARCGPTLGFAPRTAARTGRPDARVRAGRLEPRARAPGVLGAARRRPRPRRAGTNCRSRPIGLVR